MANKMRVLIACEFSGTVREAFAAKGHDAWSCDLLETEITGNHIQDDVLNHLNDGWDLMIAHPPCTYLSCAGLIWNTKDQSRNQKTIDAYEFVKTLFECQIPKICIENPVGWLNTHWKKGTQTINPFDFGDPFLKRTCLWLKNLPKLVFYDESCEFGTNLRVKPEYYYIQTGKSYRLRNYRLDKTVRNSKDRSRTFAGIARAMADQWG